uniref:hypothetical protein n=1 Tax=Arenibacter lacus TaxID=2608629 RepID=UPI001CC77DA4
LLSSKQLAINNGVRPRYRLTTSKETKLSSSLFQREVVCLKVQTGGINYGYINHSTMLRDLYRTRKC